MFRVSFRLILAALSTLTAAAILFYARADPVPHDVTARVTAAEFWTALARPVEARRPSNILVYPPRLGVQLVTCIGHPVNGGKAAWRYLYITTPAGAPTVEARLKGLGVGFRTPWQEAAWVRSGPWVGFAIAAMLVMWGWAMSLKKMLVEATAKNAQVQPSAPPVPKVSTVDLEKVRELDEELERSLAEQGAAPPVGSSSVAPSSSVAAPVALGGGPLQAMEKPVEEKKDYLGEYYPVAKPKEKHGFSLLEVLVVIGIIGVLLALLLPTLVGARRDANQIACEANLRSIDQGLVIYEGENGGCIPASYSYTGQTIVNGVQTFTSQGYTHWSYFLYHSGSTPNNAFLCPELDQGGLPPTDTTDDNLLPGQVSESTGVVDQQAPRMAYTLNEALSPRNKFAMGFQAALRVYQFIRASSVPHASGTILATEWGRNAARFAATAGSGNFYLYSHRPVHGFVGLDGTLDMYQLNPSIHYRRVTAADLDPDPGMASSSATRLDWVGRNHGKANGYPDQRRTNFLYLDGHVECKSIYDTLQPFEWGESFYTLKPGGDLQ